MTDTSNNDSTSVSERNGSYLSDISDEQSIVSVKNFKLYTEEENSDDFVSDIRISIDNPRKHAETFETYVTYRITVMPLPNKHSFLGHLDRYAKDFILFRMVMLERFLNRIIKHPILSYSEHLKTFLMENTADLSSQKRNNSTAGLLTKVSEGLYNLTTIYNIKEKFVEFEETKQYVMSFHEKLLAFDQIVCRLLKERKGLIKNMNQLAVEFENWSSSEIILSDFLLSVAHTLANVACEHDALLVHPLEYCTVQPIREYILYIESVKDVLTRRDNVQIQYELTIEECHQKSTRTNDDKLHIANEDLRSDLDRWFYEKNSDMKRILLAFSDQYINYYCKILVIWENCLKKVNSPLNEAS